MTIDSSSRLTVIDHGRISELLVPEPFEPQNLTITMTVSNTRGAFAVRYSKMLGRVDIFAS